MHHLWRVTMTVAAGALAAGNFLRIEDEGELPRVVAHVVLGAAWTVAGLWVFFGAEE